MQPAATVTLVRDATRGRVSDGEAAGGLEVWVMRRASTMAFAPDVTVFPGGGVDPRDADPALPWRGPSPSDWAQLLGVGEPEARCLVVAAAREVFEECGVLLAGDADGEAPPDLGGSHWQSRREALVHREVAFAQVLEEHGLALRTDLLRPRARWVTPQFESRRYDTFFFAARVPHGQAPDGRTSEAVTADWASPADLAGQFERGEIILLPPTQDQVRRLGATADVAALMAQTLPVPLPRIEPRLTRRGEDLVLICEEESP